MPQPAGTDAELRARLQAIHERLAAAYGLPVLTRTTDPTEELVRTILSQNTNDRNRDLAFARLRNMFPTWAEVAAAPNAALAEAIRQGGLAEVKAARIKQALRAIHDRSGSYSLSFICDMETEEALRWLQSLAGVGPKTAACVLLFSCGRPIMPVDTHVLRVCKRLGILPERAFAAAAHSLLQATTPPELVYPLHINLIRHGRAICRARRPLCAQCLLADLCRYAAQKGEVPER